MDEKGRSPLLMAGLTLALYFSGLFVYVTPLPFVYLALRRGLPSLYSPALTTLAVVCGLYVFGIEPLSALYRHHTALMWLLPIPSLGLTPHFSSRIVTVFGIGYFAFYLGVGYAVANVLALPRRVFPRTAAAVGVIFLSAIAFHAVLLMPEAERLLADFHGYMTRGIEQVIALQDSATADSAELLYIRSHAPQIIRYTTWLMPAFLFTTVAGIFLLNLILAKRLFRPFFPGLGDIVLTRFRIPFPVVWVVIFAIAVLLANYMTVTFEPAHFTLLNLAIVAAMAYFFQGFAILIHYLDAKGVTGFLRLAVYFTAVMFAQATAVLLVALGFIDNWLDVRKLDAPAPRTPPKTGPSAPV